MELEAHYGLTRIQGADHSLRHQRDGRAGTTILHHHLNYRWTQSLSVMTTGRTELLEDGQRRLYRRGDPPGTTGRMQQRAEEAGVHRCKRRTRPRNLPGARQSAVQGSEADYLL
jgi:hypothetical protein